MFLYALSNSGGQDKQLSLAGKVSALEVGAGALGVGVGILGFVLPLILGSGPFPGALAVMGVGGALLVDGGLTQVIITLQLLSKRQREEVGN